MRTISVRRWSVMFVGALFALMLAACGGASTPAPAANTLQPAATSQPSQPTSAAQPAKPALLRVGALNDDYRQDPKDPGRTTVGMATVNTNIFDTLTRMDKNYQVQPMLAESWEFIKPSTWRFKLRKGVTFHNGKPFTSAAVVENMQRISQGAFAGILKIDANSTKAVDDFTVDITTKGNVLLPSQLVHPIFGVPAPGSDLLKEQIGTGPFKLVEYVQKDHITVEKNPNYWGDKAKVDRITFRFYPDPNTRVLALQAGDVDLIYDVPRESAGVLSSNNKLKVISAPVVAYQAMSFMLNGKEPYTIGQDIKVREAFGYAIDRKAIIESSFDGRAAVSQTFIPASVLGKYADTVKGYNTDLDKAKALLDAAGWKAGADGMRSKDGKPLRLEMICCFPSASANGRTPELLQAQLKKVGADVSIVNLPDDNVYDQRLTDQRGDLWVEIGNQNTAFPCFLSQFLYYGRAEKPNNYQAAFAPGKLFPAFDDALDACAKDTDLDAVSKDAATSMQVLIDQARVTIPLVGVYRIWATNDKVQGFDPNPVFIHVRWEGVSVAP